MAFDFCVGEGAAHDDGRIVERVGDCFVGGWYGVSIRKGGWHAMEVIDEDSVFFECKEEAVVKHGGGGNLRSD